MDRARGEAAVGQVYGFLVGGVIFFTAFAALVWTMRAGVDEAPEAGAQQGQDADSLAGLVLGDPGAGWATPDALGRFGLAQGDGDLHADHLHLLSNATLDALPNGLVEYEEARAALDLSGVAGFRLRVTPLDYEAALRQHDFSHVKALYIGDFATPGTTTLAYGQGTIANANVALNASMNTNTGLERTVVDSVGVDFDNEVHLAPGKPDVRVYTDAGGTTSATLLDHLGLSSYDGDVLYDNKQYLDAVLPGKLATGGYDLLVLGSAIDHSTLTANSVKNAIDAFVRGGGTLMVFGSPGGNFNWMQPIMDVSAASVSGAVTAPDPDHPILVTPNDLDWADYPTNNLAWTLGVPANFEDVLVQGGKPVLAISNDGAIGSGHVLLSSAQPRAIAASLGTDEAADFMFNMLLYDADAARDPTVAFGPDPPSGMPVSSAVRTAVVADAGLDIPVRVELLAWGT